jgi:hypothetical protein
MNYVYKHLIGIQTDTQQMKFRRCEVCPATCVIFVIFLYLGFFKFESSLGVALGKVRLCRQTETRRRRPGGLCRGRRGGGGGGMHYAWRRGGAMIDEGPYWVRMGYYDKGLQRRR